MTENDATVESLSIVAETCWYHHRREPYTESDYRVCFECNHVFRSETELIVETNWLRVHPDAPPVLDGSEVRSCPLCAHDF